MKAVLIAAALTAALTTTSARADEAAAAAQIFAFEHPYSKDVATPEQVASTARSFRTSPEYQEGLRICVNTAVNAIIARTTTDANTAAYCDAFATGYAEARENDEDARVDRLVKAREAADAEKGKK